MTKKVKNLEWKEIDKETIIFDYKKNAFFVLNETGGFIWKKINGKNTDKKISLGLAKEYNIPEKKALSDTKQFIKRLFSAKLVRR